jgi:hypothetical protein
MVLVALFFAASPVQAAADLNGPHYNLNIIGVSKDKVQDVPAWGNENRHTMFVPLERKTNIYMTQANATDADPDDDFAVIDANGCDGRAAFELAPGYYEAYARAVGTPGGKVNITPNAEFDIDGDGVADTATTDFYLGSIELSHTKKPVWERVTGLFIADVFLWNDDGTLFDSYSNTWIFDIPELLSYWWDYNNQGCKVLQVRFYPVDEQPEVPNL